MFKFQISDNSGHSFLWVKSKKDRNALEDILCRNGYLVEITDYVTEK